MVVISPPIINIIIRGRDIDAIIFANKEDKPLYYFIHISILKMYVVK